MSDQIVIRDLTRADDVETLVQIALAAWRPIYAFYRQTLGDEMFLAFHPHWQDEKAGQIRRACAPGSAAHGCVAESGGQIVGFVTFYVQQRAGTAEIGNNAVHPDWQGKGIGPRMYEAALQRMRMLGVRYVKVSTGGDPAHAPARHAYAKVGFSTELPEVTYFLEL